MLIEQTMTSIGVRVGLLKWPDENLITHLCPRVVEIATGMISRMRASGAYQLRR